MSLSAPTPNRRTILQADLGEVTLARPEWNIRRGARDLRQHKAAYRAADLPHFAEGQVWNMAGDAWILRVGGREPAQLTTQEQGGFLASADVERAPGVAEVNVWRPPTDLPGSGANVLGGPGSLISVVPGFQKRVTAGQGWDEQQLPDDTAAYPPPPDPVAPLYPVDRILAGNVSYPANTPFTLFWANAGKDLGADVFLRFYFGGPANALPAGAAAGEWCLALRENGSATLYERNPSQEPPWEVRSEFEWGETFGFAAELGGLNIIPYGRNRMAIRGAPTTGREGGGFTLGGLLMSQSTVAVQAQTGRTLHLVQEGKADHRHLYGMTGEGPVRVDSRRTSRTILAVARQKFALEGVLFDAPFLTPEIPAGTPLYPLLHYYLIDPDACNIHISLYNAETHAPLLQSGQAFLSQAGCRRYYARIDFESDGTQTPVLWGYDIYAGSAWETRLSVPTLTAQILGVQLSGSGTTPDSENGGLQVKDVTDALPLLRLRDRIRSLVSVQNATTGTVISHLMEGEITQPEATLRGTPDRLWPSPNWHDYDVRMVGLWARMEEQFHVGMPKSFLSSLDSAHPARDVKGDPLPWRITDAIVWLLNQAGFPADEVQVPNLPLRLWPSSHPSPEDYSVMPGTPYGRMAADLARDYLGMVLLRDPNAGTRGMWRLIGAPNPLAGPYLCTFTTDPPPFPGRIVTAPDAYGVGVNFIENDTWKTSVRAPEGNVVTVIGYGKGDTEEGARQLVAPLINYDSIYNPASPHFLGRQVPIVHHDPNLSTQEAVNWVAWRIYQRACFAEKWFRFRARLVLVSNLETGDPWQNPGLLRPLRVNDLVYIKRGGVLYPAVLRSVAPDYQTDLYQAAEYEGRFV